MTRYRVAVTSSAEKELSRLPATIISRVVVVLQSLQTNPRPPGCKKLKGFANLWRVRIGDYRIVYSIEDVILLVEVQAVGHRKDIYD